LTYTATDKNGYSQTWTSAAFTVGSTTNTGTTSGKITISPVNYPTGTFTPKSFSLTGTITSSVALKSVTATLTKDGKAVQTATATTSATSFTIKNSTIDKNLKFAGLSNGSYTLTYTATDKNGYSQTWTSAAFTVGSTTNTGTTSGKITISPVNYPTGNFTPKSFSLTGTITSSVALKSITATLTKDGKAVQTATASTSATSFTIKNSTIDKNLKFAGLSNGSYTLTYTATDKNGYSQTWTSAAFTVGSTTNTGTTSGKITISPVNYPTGTFTPKSFSLTGTITSSVALKSVSATLYRSGTAVQTTTANTSAKSYTIKGSVLDKNLKFASLTSGSYTLVYSATDQSGNTQTWTSPEFTVGSGTTTSTTKSSITISPSSYPTGTISAKAFSLTGTISSTVKLKSVSATIYSESGTAVQTVTASTSAKSYSIKNSTLDNKMKFGSLSKGRYTLVYSATDTNGNTQTWTSPVFTVG
jgi:hypothetical protein